MINEAILAKMGGINNFYAALVIGLIQLLPIITDKKALRVVGLCGSVLGALFSLRIPFCAILFGDIFTMICGGGLGEYKARVTFFGYAVVILSFALAVMQIILYRLTKKRIHSQTDLQE